MIATGGGIGGYELHKDVIETKVPPLFRLSFFGGETVDEGSSDIEGKLFGTHIHGIFDEPAFRNFILKMTGKFVPSKVSDVSYEKTLDGTLEHIADVFTEAIDKKFFDELLKGGTG
jgi:cobyric acid synthase